MGGWVGEGLKRWVCTRRVARGEQRGGRRRGQCCVCGLGGLWMGWVGGLLAVSTGGWLNESNKWVGEY